MGYTVNFKRTKDGAKSSRHYDIAWNGDYWWIEGNMACDCNRHLEFERGLGREPEGHHPCGNQDYEIQDIISDDGKILWSNFGD